MILLNIIVSHNIFCFENELQGYWSSVEDISKSTFSKQLLLVVKLLLTLECPGGWVGGGQMDSPRFFQAKDWSLESFKINFQYL